ncbi:MAG: peptidase S41 [Desulfobacteraceae bacterium 4572_130]|nr:MAG: peptidase S41 [Desulfobacteraceae bacterium 4572_130]
MKIEIKQYIIKLGFPIIAVALILILGCGFYHSLLAGEAKTYESLKLFSNVLEELENKYVDEVDTRKLIHNAVKGMVASLDPHSVFMPPEAFDELQDDTKGEFGGIGIVITMKQGILTVISPIEGTPAYKAGIVAGDLIIKINGKTTKGMALWESVKKMRGPKGKQVIITILRKDKQIDYKLTRDIIPMNSVRSVTIQQGYGYIWITNFRLNTSDEVEKALLKMESGDIPLKGLIIDLRNNPGGLLNQAVNIADMFLEKGKIVSIKGRFKENNEVFSAGFNKKKRVYPIVVLINSGSASASEIVAGALQDNKRAIILGTTSFGKGSVQSVKSLKDGFGLKYTIARYYTPSGTSIQAEGIKPDIKVEYVLDKEKTKQADTDEKIVREKDLKNHLKSEKDKKKQSRERGERDKNNKKVRGIISLEKLNRDSQVKRALDILIAHNIFINRK